VADGFESFCCSQYFPNTITLLVGAILQYVYAIDHVTIRRKGRNDGKAEEKRGMLETRWRAEAGGIEKSFTRIAHEVLSACMRGVRGMVHALDRRTLRAMRGCMPAHPIFRCS
jgi:hypothetical protein